MAYSHLCDPHLYGMGTHSIPCRSPGPRGTRPEWTPGVNCTNPAPKPTRRGRWAALFSSPFTDTITTDTRLYAGMPTIVVGLPSGERVRVEAATTERDRNGHLHLYDEAGNARGDFPSGSYAVPDSALAE